MKERPILFSAPMVRAILAGTKTQTRRGVKISKRLPHSGVLGWVEETVAGVSCPEPGWYTARLNAPGIQYTFRIKCPYGQPGDRLWVRETFAIQNGERAVWYRADVDAGVAAWEAAGSECSRWKPSIHMPRWASRITLEIVSVRVERLQDISGPDCWAEGIECAGWDCEKYGSVVHCYRDLWESINGPGSWDVNPWVWIITFKRVEAPNAR